MVRTHAEMNTDRAQRYLKQLVSHLQPHCTVEHDAESTRITLPPDHGSGRCVLTPLPDRLDIAAEAAREDDLTHLQHVITSHLERFGKRDGLGVSWES
ncbi:hypothetical protein SAMN04487905_10253 [Actinopolyspora xinjiangensis]|uniref:DUF2218 domain-containing protein n=1 Tax=Actinopolyspora xinjiangensis TaxID=405564 RepID=A0A1H0Q2U5_9ACTN|nr:DUF2218 domain-containing protein [Actinopolyspora xinjiangensis]SDP11737.1 hypothetical protein SAMN04487905_10253 [Actinopolyspora xinjiangensis]